MLYEVEVVADGNSPMDLNRVFDLLTDPPARPAPRRPRSRGQRRLVRRDRMGGRATLPGHGRAVRGFRRGRDNAHIRRRGRQYASNRLKIPPTGTPLTPSSGGEACLMLGSDVRIEYVPPEWDYSQHPH